MLEARSALRRHSGGAKKDKIGVIENLLPKVDATPHRRGDGVHLRQGAGRIGDTISMRPAWAWLPRCSQRRGGRSPELPVDALAADAIDANAQTRVVPGRIPAGWKAVDIGPESAKRRRVIRAQDRGLERPDGIRDRSLRGRHARVAQAMAASSALTVVGGSDSVTALESWAWPIRSHVSTGGGASLSSEGKVLPGIAALQDK